MEKEKKEVKEKVKETKKVEKESETKKTEKTKQIVPLVTCRMLFISVLDKIYMVILALMLIGILYATFNGDMSSLHYSFWTRVCTLIPAFIVLFIVYLFMNWFYKCAAKTMLCVTENEVYAEKYIPFKNSETSIPLTKITGISTVNLFWIFRCVIIHQYGKMPSIFWTWNNQEFKSKVNELITTDKDPIENEFEDKNIINKDQYVYLKYLGIVVAAIIALIGVVRFFNYVFSAEKSIPGTYYYESNRFVLSKDGSCEIDDIIS